MTFKGIFSFLRDKEVRLWYIRLGLYKRSFYAKKTFIKFYFNCEHLGFKQFVRNFNDFTAFANRGWPGRIVGLWG